MRGEPPPPKKKKRKKEKKYEDKLRRNGNMPSSEKVTKGVE